MDRSRLARRVAPLLAVAALAGAGAAPARAASVVYLDASSNIWIATPDGTDHKQVTSDATPDKRYHAPVADDAGTILSYGRPDTWWGRLMDQDGHDVRGPWLLPAPTCSVGPLLTDISADGKLIATTWLDAGTGTMSCLQVGTLTTSMLYGDAPTLNAHNGSATLPSFDGLSSPRWIYRPNQRLGGISNDGIWVQDLETGNPSGSLGGWIAVPAASADLDSFDVSRAADRVLVETSADGAPDGGERRDLELLTFTGAPPNAPATHVCFVDGLVASSTTPARPRWSPDGTMIVWSAPEGVYASPAPVAGSGDQCVLQPKLIAAGGAWASWSAADLKRPAPPSGGSGTTTPPTSTPGTSATGGAAQTLSVPKLVRATRASGIALTLRLQRAARITIRVERLPASHSGRARLLGSVALSGRAGANTLRLRRVRGRALGRGRYRLTISVAGAPSRRLVVTVR